jgi:hypothetical protein
MSGILKQSPSAFGGQFGEANVRRPARRFHSSSDFAFRSDAGGGSTAMQCMMRLLLSFAPATNGDQG